MSFNACRQAPSRALIAPATQRSAGCQHRCRICDHGIACDIHLRAVGNAVKQQTTDVARRTPPISAVVPAGSTVEDSTRRPATCSAATRTRDLRQAAPDPSARQTDDSMPSGSNWQLLQTAPPASPRPFSPVLRDQLVLSPLTLPPSGSAPDLPARCGVTSEMLRTRKISAAPIYPVHFSLHRFATTPVSRTGILSAPTKFHYPNIARTSSDGRPISHLIVVARRSVQVPQHSYQNDIPSSAGDACLLFRRKNIPGRRHECTTYHPPSFDHLPRLPQLPVTAFDRCRTCTASSSPSSHAIRILRLK